MNESSSEQPIAREGGIGATIMPEPDSGEAAIIRADEQSKMVEAVTAEATIVNGGVPTRTVSFDSVSKFLAAALAVLYVSGFLITSLHNFRYGFSEMNPLRPRILSAGGWFALFVAVPAVLVWEMRRHSAAKDNKINISNLSALVATYMSSAILLVSYSSDLFDFDNASQPSGQEPLPLQKIVLVVLGVVMGITAVISAIVFLLHKLKPNIRDLIISVAIILTYGISAISGYWDIFVKHHFSWNAMYLWVLMVGGFIYYEFKQRDWILKAGFWQRTVVGSFVMLTTFATVYYPHIKAKWGGGALIPVELTLSVNANATVVDTLLIDETDAGYYVVVRGDSFATFIPRTGISSVYYGQGNKHPLYSKDATPPSQPTANNTK